MEKARDSYGTKPSRVILSLAVGAATGACLIALSYLWSYVQARGIQYVLDYSLQPSLIIFTAALIVWAIGLIVFGLTLWWLLHKAGLRHWLVAVVVGATVTLLVSFGLQTRAFELIPPPSNSRFSAGDAGGPTVINNRRTPHGWWVAFRGSLMLSAGGVLVALVIWRIAYRRLDDNGRL